MRRSGLTCHAIRRDVCYATRRWFDMAFVMCVLLSISLSALGQTTRPATRPAGSSTTKPANTASIQPTTSPLRVTGPLVAKDMMEALVAEFGLASAGSSGAAPNGSASPGAVRLEYSRNDMAKGAAGTLLSGRDFVLTLGKLGDKDIPVSRDRWEALAIEEHVVAARAVAIVVHERNPLESLTMDQAVMLFSGKAKDWSAFGGPAKAIRRYGLVVNTPQATLFHEKILSAAKCGPMIRKKDSSEVLAALANDPLAVAFVDAVSALSAGDSIKIVAIGQADDSATTGGGATGGSTKATPSKPSPATATPNKSSSGSATEDTMADIGPVLPNAQTIKDGTYPLASTLVLYISPKSSSQVGQEFVEFLQTGKGDAVIRKNSFMPTLRAESIDAIAAFDRLYGPLIKRVKATPDTADDLALADRMTQSARRGKLDAGLVAAMCEAAYDLSATVPGGQATAFEALRVLAEQVPDKRFDAAVKRAAIYQWAYEESLSQSDDEHVTKANGEHFVEALMAAADAGTAARKFTEASDVWVQALTLAEELNSPHVTTLLERQSAFDARTKSVKRLATMESQLREDPRDPTLRRNLLDLHLLELDNPTAAAKFLDAADSSEESLKTNIPLAVTAVEKLSEDSALKLAEWYGDLIDQAGPGGKEMLTARAQACYRRFFELHPNRNDAKATRARLGIEKIGGEMLDITATTPKPPAKTPSSSDEVVRLILTGVKPDELTDLKLAELVAANPDVTHIMFEDIGKATQITDLRPLERLARLQRLELLNAENLKDITPLAKMTGLTVLKISYTEVDDLTPLANLTKLSVLDLSFSKNISDIKPLSRLVNVMELNLNDCPGVTDIAPIAKMANMWNLSLRKCVEVHDLAPLEKLPKLNLLNLSGCPNLKVRQLGALTRLTDLELRGCDNLTDDDLAWLANRLKKCKISHERLDQK